MQNTACLLMECFMPSIMNQQKFQRYTFVVTKGEMEKYWRKLSLVYVMEESVDPNNPNGIIEHKLQWHSQSLHDINFKNNHA